MVKVTKMTVDDQRVKLPNRSACQEIRDDAYSLFLLMTCRYGNIAAERKSLTEGFIRRPVEMWTVS